MDPCGRRRAAETRPQSSFIRAGSARSLTTFLCWANRTFEDRTGPLTSSAFFEGSFHGSLNYDFRRPVELKMPTLPKVVFSDQFFYHSVKAFIFLSPQYFGRSASHCGRGQPQ